VAAVVRSDEGHVTRLVLDRPASRNALSLGMLEELAAALHQVAVDREVHVVVLAGAGVAFSAGHDLRELAEHPDDGYRRDLFERCAEVMVAIDELPQPVIAEVHGVATAAGCQLVAACDLAVAGASARFATPGVDIGLFCSTPAVALTRAVAPKHAAALLYTGELVDADHALRIGLVNQVVPDDAVGDAVAALAGQIAAKPPAVVSLGKAALRRQRGLGLRAAYEVASEAMVDNLSLPEAAEGIGAFLQKRPPSWRAR
jgi:enoyl-CoA hydratase/carnithine racemase